MSHIGPKRALFNTVAPSIPFGGDPYWNNVVVLANFPTGNPTYNAKSGGNTISQYNNTRWSYTGPITSVATPTQFSGTNSGQWQTQANGLTVGNMNLTSNFTIEGWFNSSNVAGVYGVGQLLFTGTGGSPGVNLNGDGTMTLYWAGTYHFTSVLFTNNTWHHVALTKNGDVTSLWVDGNLVTGVTVSSGYGSQPIIIGNTYSPTYDGGWFGNIQEIRLTSGVSRYNSAFTPPTAPFPTY